MTPHIVDKVHLCIYTWNMKQPNNLFWLNADSSDFTEMRKNKFYFVDKSLFISRLLDCEGKVILFLRPRSYGKTLNMTMIQRFFACNMGDGKDPDANADVTRELFDGLYVCNDPKAMNELGKYPVVFLNFKDLQFGDCWSWQEFSAKCSDYLYNYFFQFKYLLESNNLNDDEKNSLAMLCSRDISMQYYENFAELYRNNQELSIFHNGLRLLTISLAKHYDAPVILLIDAYDAPLTMADGNGYYYEMLNFMRSFLGAGLKDNPSLKFSCITATTLVAKEIIFKGMTNFMFDSSDSRLFSDSFGFTIQEIDAITNYFDINKTLPEEFDSYYNQYIPEEPRIYNPWWTMHFFAHDTLPKSKWREKAEAFREIFEASDAYEYDDDE